MKNADERASSNAGELVSKSAVAGSRPPRAAADSKAGPARGKDNPAPTCAEAVPPVAALAEAAKHPAPVPASADTVEPGRRRREVRLPSFRRYDGRAGRCPRCGRLLQPLRGSRMTELEELR